MANVPEIVAHFFKSYFFSFANTSLLPTELLAHRNEFLTKYVCV